MTIKFTKMHGLGNDFAVFDAINQDIHLNSSQIAALAQRNTGIGFDQCLFIEPSQKQGIDFNYRIFNANGQEVSQCGNGARCLALFAKHSGLTNKNKISIATKTTIMNLNINPDNTVTVEMLTPQFNPKNIPFNVEQQSPTYDLKLSNDHTVKIHALSVGNPHAVLVVPSIDLAPVATIGQEISLHPCFPEQTNTGFMQIIDSHNIKLRVYERGCGETKACGSGAVAAAAIGCSYYGLENEVKVHLLGGELLIHWPHKKGPIYLTGPATFVYEGNLL